MQVEMKLCAYYLECTQFNLLMQYTVFRHYDYVVASIDPPGPGQ